MIIENATDALNEKLAEVVATSQMALTIYDPVAADIRIIRNAETNLGDLCADAYRDQSGADVAFVNGGDGFTMFRGCKLLQEDVKLFCIEWDRTLEPLCRTIQVRM